MSTAPEVTCPACESSSVRVATITDYVIYMRCDRCGHVWSVPKPQGPTFER